MRKPVARHELQLLQINARADDRPVISDTVVAAVLVTLPPGPSCDNSDSWLVYWSAVISNHDIGMHACNLFHDVPAELSSSFLRISCHS